MRRDLHLSALALAAFATASQATEIECDRSGSKTTPSPDGRWTASVQEEVCTTISGGAAAGITVVLISTDDEKRRKRVFLMPVPRSREDWPRIRWQGPSVLEVRVPNLSEPGPPEPAFEGIRISLAFCGDNPGDRQALADYKAAVKQWQKEMGAWVARRKQDESSAGPRPPRPEEPALPSGRCTD
ncbi:MAG: hypothetical protein RLZZ393_2111 [Pseudomonadota bacterium]|jgi:hypothetical protein